MYRSSDVIQTRAAFLGLVPTIERRVRFALRHRDAVDREEGVAECVATAFAAQARLAARGRDAVREFPEALVGYAVLSAKAGRLLGKTSSTDVLAALARRRRGFRVESLSCLAARETKGRSDRLGRFDDRLQDNTRTAVPEQVAFRIDFPAFLRRLSPRDRALVEFLALGHSGRAAAGRFGLTAGRVSQLRRIWLDRWQQSQGDIVAGKVRPLASWACSPATRTA
jgi:hypothetical protein